MPFESSKSPEELASERKAKAASTVAKAGANLLKVSRKRGMDPEVKEKLKTLAEEVHQISVKMNS